MKRKCVYCGDAFDARYRQQKYCCTKHYHVDSKERAAESGIGFRKRTMALGAHGDDTLLIVARKLDVLHAPMKERMVILDDLLREKQSVGSEVRQRYKAIGAKRKVTLRKKLIELETRARREFRFGSHRE